MPVPRPALNGPLHLATHVLLVLIGWLTFAVFWWQVLSDGPHDLSNIIWLLAGTLVLLPVSTLYWVLHNRSIYARKGPRRRVQQAETAYVRDWAGRPVQAEFDRLRYASHIEIDSASGAKRFRPMDPVVQAA
jgi:hypothetical protein